MFGKSKKSNGVEASPAVEGLLSIVEDRLQKEVFEKSSGKVLIVIFPRFSDLPENESFFCVECKYLCTH
jgi:hypothetical protein